MESRGEKRLRCWESVMPKGVIEAQCPICGCSVIRYSSTSGNTFQQMHIVSQREGGSDQSWNLMPGCGCNQNMRHMNLVDWMGTRGYKRQLLKSAFITKYKSLVAPCNRPPHDREQLVKWIYNTYHPRFLEEYRDWLILLDQDLQSVQSDDGETTVKLEELPRVIKEEKKVIPIPTTDTLLDIKKVNLVTQRKSPYFTRTYQHNCRKQLAHTNIHMPYPHHVVPNKRARK
jgi:hypothetical protein